MASDNLIQAAIGALEGFNSVALPYYKQKQEQEYKLQDYLSQYDYAKKLQELKGEQEIQLEQEKQKGIGNAIYDENNRIIGYRTHTGIVQTKQPGVMNVNITKIGEREQNGEVFPAEITTIPGYQTLTEPQAQARIKFQQETRQKNLSLKQSAEAKNAQLQMSHPFLNLFGSVPQVQVPKIDEQGNLITQNSTQQSNISVNKNDLLNNLIRKHSQ